MTVLEGRVIATTRCIGSDHRWVQRLTEEGVAVVSWRTIVTEPTDEPEALRRAVAAIDEYDWVAFTSAAAVEAVTELAGTAPTRARVAAVGRSTSQALEAAGWCVAVIGSAGALALVSSWAAKYELSGAQVLFPAGSLARPTLEDQLIRRGAHVDRVEAYRTRTVSPDADRVRADLHLGVDVVTFASPSAVRSLAGALARDWPQALRGSVVVSIGPTTSNALVDAGLDLERIVMADQPSIDGLMEAAESALARIATRSQESPV